MVAGSMPWDMEGESPNSTDHLTNAEHYFEVLQLSFLNMGV